MSVSAVEFCERYIGWLEMIDPVIKPEYYPAIRKLYCTAPQDLITPEAMFVSAEHAIGFIWCMLINTHKQLNKDAANASQQ